MSARSVAFLVGVDQFSDPAFTSLRFCRNDLDGMARVLGDPKMGGFEIVVQWNKRHHEILESLDRTVATLVPGDNFLFYFAGHGRRSQQAGKLYLVATDTKLDTLRTTGIPIDTALEIVRESRCSNRALVLDCCYSGAIGEVYRGGDATAGLNDLARNSGTYILTASTAIELAEERESTGSSGKSGNGIFTRYFIEALETGDVHLGDSDQITIDAVYDYIHQHISAQATQKPQRFVIDGAGNFIVGHSYGRRWERRRPDLLRRFAELLDQNIIDDKQFLAARKIFRKSWSVMSLAEKAIGESALDAIDEKISVTEFCARLNHVVSVPIKPQARIVTRALWFVFGGLYMAAGWVFAAIIMAITIVGLPWTRAAFNIAVYTLMPFGQKAVNRAEYTGVNVGTGPLGVIGNIIWLVLAGWWLALGHLITAILLAITIIGIPFARRHWKLAGVALWPIGKMIVPADDAPRPDR